MLTIRRAEPRDIAAIVRCLERAFAPYRAAYTRRAFADTVLTVRAGRRRMEHMCVLVAVSEADEIIGTIAHEIAESGLGHLRGMAVDPGFHGKGVARELLSAAEAALRCSGCSRVTLDTTAPLERAIAFYRREGYQPTGAVRDFFGMPLIEYAKDL